MSKNKLSWSIALFLIAIISLPIAHAQIVPARSQLYFLLINAAIIFVVLFILQSFLIKGKTEKETTSVWVIMILASLLLAYLFGRTGLLLAEGQPLARFFRIFVLVNAIIIGAVMYFVLGLLKIGNLQSPEGKTGYGILIFLVALIFAVKIGNQWIWSLATVRQLIDYLFGAEGILNPSPPAYRLWTFLVSATLLAFFFNNYLLKGATGANTKVNYALAILIAATMARSGVNLQRVVILGEIIFLIVLAEAMKTTIGDKWYMNWWVSLFLVGWASAAMTYGTEYQGLLASPIGRILYTMGLISLDGTTVAKPTSWSWWGIVGIGALLALLVFGGVIAGGAYIISRGEKVWKFGEIRKRLGRNIINAIRLGWNKLLGKTEAGEKVWIKRLLEPDRLPAILRENVVYLFSLSNYLKRMYIMYSKMAQVKKAEEVCNEMMKQIDRFTDIKKLEQEIYNIRNGGEVDGKPEVGWFEGNRRVIDEIKNIINFLREYHEDIVKEVIPKDTRKVNDYYNTASRLRDRLSRAISEVQTAVDVLLAPRAIAYGAHQPIKAWKYLVLDQCNPYGEYEHFYKFVDKGTELYEYDEETLRKKIVKAEDRLEVNLWGEVLKDKHKQLDNFFKPWEESKKTAPRRVVDPNKIYDLGTFIGPEKPAHIMTYIIRDWEGFIQDLRFGEFKYYSKGIMDYISRLGTASDDPRRLGRDEFFDEKNIQTTIDFKSPDNPAFDRRAHNSPGFIRYGGRIFYDDRTEEIKDSNRDRNPYPAISSRGMSKYIPELTQRDVDDITKARDYLSRFLRDTGETLTGPKDAYKGISSLGEEETAQEGGK